MPDVAQESPTSEPKAKSKWKGKTPRSSRDFDSAIAPIVINETLNGDHRTCKCRLPDGRVDNITIIEGVHDLKDSNPKVWHRLVKQLKTWGVITLLATGGATLVASQLGNFVK